MISRIWHGWTTPANADKYEAMLKEEIFVGIQNRHIRGFKGIQLLRREVGEEVEFSNFRGHNTKLLTMALKSGIGFVTA